MVGKRARSSSLLSRKLQVSWKSGELSCSMNTSVAAMTAARLILLEYQLMSVLVSPALWGAVKIEKNHSIKISIQ